MPDDAAYAPNWWRILLIDACVGLGLIAAGIAGALLWTPAAWLLVPLGVFYDFLVCKRVLRWRALRAQRPPGQG